MEIKTLFPCCGLLFISLFQAVLRFAAHADPIPQVPIAPVIDYASRVDPFIGTQGAGMTYPGAQAPFGMISPGPNTAFKNYGDGSSRSGYQYDGKNIVSFSLTHVSGVGLHAAQDLPFMPCVGDLNVSPVGNREAYQSAFTSTRQVASPGFYRVPLETSKTLVSIASTTRSAIIRLDYPSTAKANLIFSPANCGTAISDSKLTISPDAREIEGWAASGDFADAPFHPEKHPYRIYFVAVFDRPLSGYGTWQDQRKTEGALQSNGVDGAAYVRFDCSKDTGSRVNMRLAISYVSVKGARENLRREIPFPDMEKVRSATGRSWNALLGRIRVSGGGRNRIRSFTTALYQNALQPNVFDDVDGQYSGFDHQVHRIPDGHHFYATFSLWDTYRSTAQLQALWVPDRASDMVQSLLLASLQAPGGGLPTWSLNNNDTGVMGTYSADPFIANVYAFGARDFDLKLARDRMVLTGTTEMKCGDGAAWWGLADYQKLGWKPESASTTLEYSIADFSIAQICRAADDDDNARRFLARSMSCFNTFNPATGFMQARRADGDWVEPFDPGTQRGFTEGNAAQYTWMTPHNIERLVELMGGPEKTRRRLDDFFEPLLIGGWHTADAKFWLGNEPTMSVPTIYNWVGQPWKTQKLMRQVIEQYRDTPDGYVGNDDVGTMSALYVFSALGLYPAIPGIGGFTVSTPLFKNSTIELQSGKTLRIHAANAGFDKTYIQDMSINGKARSSLWMSLEEISANETTHLNFELSANPNKKWGSASGDAPPSFAAPG